MCWAKSLDEKCPLLTLHRGLCLAVLTPAQVTRLQQGCSLGTEQPAPGKQQFWYASLVGSG